MQSILRCKIGIGGLVESVGRVTVVKTFAYLFLGLCSFAPLCAEEAASPAPSAPPAQENGYTINYNTVSIIEYIRFASKVCNANFIYNEADLNFSVSVVSDAPITPENVMATLLQVLRINGLMLLEQDNNLVIHRSNNVKQVASLVTGDKKGGKSPIVTRIFRVRNATAESIAAIIRPMISAEALLETSTETRQIILTDITANVDKVASLIEILDSPHTPLEIQSYEAINNAPQFLIELASQIMTPIAQGNPFILVPQPLANSIFIVSTPELIERAISILKTLDSTPKKEILTQRKLKSENIFVYKVLNRPGEEVLKSLNEIASGLSKSGVTEGDLLTTIESARYIPDTNSLLFFGSPDSLGKIKEFLTSLDAIGAMDGSGKTAASVKNSFFVYKIHQAPADTIQTSLKNFAASLDKSNASDGGLIEAIQTMKYIPETQSLLFTGPDYALKRLQELVPTFDASIGATRTSNQFLLYKPKHQSGEQLTNSLKEVTDDLKSQKLSDPALIQALQSAKWVKTNQTLLFTGDGSSIKKVEDLLATVDVPAGQFQASYLYHPKTASRQETENYLKQIADNLNKKGDYDLIATVRSAKWIEPSQSFLFQGSVSSIEKLKEFLSTFDSTSKGKRGYFLYKLQNTNGDVIEDDLENLIKNFKSSKVPNHALIDVLENIRYVKETNSLLLTGDANAIEEAKNVIAEYDYTRAPGPAKSNFLMIKPVNVAASQIEKSLQDIAANLKKADLADPSLLAAIQSMKYVESTNSLIFTGSPDALQKIQVLVKEIDVPGQKHVPIQHIGKTTFLLYKLKVASGNQVISSIKAMTADLKKSGTSDKDFLAALQSVKYVKETNSLLFTGTDESLTKVQDFVTNFDVTSLAEKMEGPIPLPGASNFVYYKPVSVPGPELEKMIQDFADNLRMGGLSDPDLFSSISSMRWVEKTQSLVFTGNPKALDQIKQLLTSFDIPSNAPNQSPTAPLEPSIQAIDNTSFLVYKLQFHKGDEIQGALRQIAKDLTMTNAPINQNLLNSINSIQWLEVTNSLLCSGDQDTLVRLKELIKNLDIPLKQVYIEMLVIETNLTNALQFGLEWGGKYKYRNAFQGTVSNTQPSLSSQQAYQNDPLMSTLNSLIPSSPAATNTQNLTFGPGFDLGVIGQVIKHKGQTFLTLGSLLQAVQTDAESSVVITPKIITQDGHTSSIFVGQNIPFIGSFVNNQGQTTVQTSNMEYRDIGLNLTLTPVLGNSDIVTLDISLDRTQTLGDVTSSTVNFNTNSATGITTSRTTMQTTVHVPDKNFLILSGFVNNSNAKVKTGLPCLGGLPLIGAAFSSDNNTVSNTNIVIFLRPHIINSVDDMRRLTSSEEEVFHDQQGSPFLIQQFNEGMELIKSVDDD